MVRRAARAAATAVAAAFLTASTPATATQAPTVLDPHGMAIAAFGGWAAWSRQDSSTGAYELVTRSPAGQISLPAVAEAKAPFDVALGPVHGSGVAAVYSRCADAPHLQGCRMLLLELGTSGTSERHLAPPGGGSNHEPAIWDGALAFLRRDRAGGSRRPDRLLVWSIGSRGVRALPLPRSRGNSTVGWPAGLTGSITGLAFNGRQVAYATSNTVGSLGETTLWFEPLGGHPQLIDQQTAGAGNVCPPQFISPVLSGRWLYAYLHACDPSANPRLDRLTRYRRGEVQSARYTFLHTGDETISSAVPDGAGVDWDSSGVERLASVSWRRISPPVAQTLCSRSDPFC